MPRIRKASPWLRLYGEQEDLLSVLTVKSLTKINKRKNVKINNCLFSQIASMLT